MIPLKVEYKQTLRGFWLRWLLATIIGTVFGMVIVFFGLASLLSRSSQIVYGVLIGGVIGAFVGTSQWLILRKYLDRVGLWVPLTLISWVVFWELELMGVLSRVLGQNSGIALIQDMLHLAVLGCLTGGLQWLLLRQKVQAAGWWVLASILGTVLGALVADGINITLGSDSPLDFLSGSIIGGIITGVCMMWLIQRASLANRPTGEI